MRNEAGFVIPVGDDIERFADRHQQYDPEENGAESVSLAEELGVTTERLEEALAHVPPVERDMLWMWFELDKRQSDIAMVHSVTQACVSYKISRALKRLRFYLSVPVMTEKELRDELAISVRKSHEETRLLWIEILVAMWKTTCQSAAAEMVGATQGRVRHVTYRETERLRVLAKTDPRVAKSAAFFCALVDQKAWSVGREYALSPHWEKWKVKTRAKNPYEIEPGSGVRRIVHDGSSDGEG